MTSFETLFDEMKRYVRWSEADPAALRALGVLAGPHFRPIADRFYERIREHDDAHAVFRDEAQIERLKVALVRWMERLCTGPHPPSPSRGRVRSACRSTSMRHGSASNSA